MPYACEALVKRLWHATPALRPTFAEALPQLQSVNDVLPVGNLGASMPRDALDSLDALSGLSLKPR